MNEIQNMLIVGVGGQGVILASAILAQAAMEAGHDTKQSEVHGMSQRGGTVSSHVRFGEKVWSPMVPEGEAHVMLAFERAEALRAAHLVAPGGVAIVNRQSIIPPIASGKNFAYPEDPIGDSRERVERVIEIDALEECRKLGNEKMVSVLLLGALSAQLDFDGAIWEKVIRSRVPKGTEDGNLAAFAKGAELATAALAAR
ncbi:indolepyruvate oxidoreductase subunit beta [bacterium]|nr:indolepyruvate oxidoreductase subunit beta [bacterium]